MPQLPIPPEGTEVPLHAVRAAMAVADPQTRLMLTLAAGYGLRRESIGRVHTIDLSAGPDLGDWLLVHVEGRRPYRGLVPIQPELAEVIREADGFLFPGDDHGHLSPQWIGRSIGKALPKGFSAASLRHTNTFLAGNHQREPDRHQLAAMSRAERDFWVSRLIVGPCAHQSSRLPHASMWTDNPIPDQDGLHPRIALKAGRPVITERVTATMNSGNTWPSRFSVLMGEAKASEPEHRVFERYVEVAGKRILVGTFELSELMPFDQGWPARIDPGRLRIQLATLYLAGINDLFLDEDLSLTMPDGTPFLLPQWQATLRAERDHLARLEDPDAPPVDGTSS